MPTRDEMATHAAIQRSARTVERMEDSLGRIADALERLAPKPPVEQSAVTAQDASVIVTALGQFQIHLEEEGEAESETASRAERLERLYSRLEG